MVLPSAVTAAPVSNIGARWVYEDLPHDRLGWALKICSPLISSIVSAMTLIQWVTRTTSACRRYRLPRAADCGPGMAPPGRDHIAVIRRKSDSVRRLRGRTGP